MDRTLTAANGFAREHGPVALICPALDRVHGVALDDDLGRPAVRAEGGGGAGTRLLARLKPAREDKKLGQFVREVASQNAKISAMVAEVGGGQAEPEGETVASGRATTMPTVLTCPRQAEREKQRCLSAIANAGSS